MSKLVIKEVGLFNFKGFADIHIPFNANGTIILGGRNGYGKTTLFDALELLFTGKIQRMTEYNDYHDNRYSISQDEKPLVFDKHFSDIVIVSAEVEFGDCHFVLQRKAKVEEMKNPVDFSAFCELRIVEMNGAERVLSAEECKHLGITTLCQSYSFLNYLSQEEATTFLKQKEADRSKMLSQLFDLERYEQYIGKIKKTQNILKELKSQWTEKKKSVDIAIEKLQSSGLKENETNIEYVQLTNDGGLHKWDEETPNLSYEEFSTLLEENGVLDRLSYLSHNMAEYKKYRRNQYITQHSSEDEICNLAFCAKYSTVEDEIQRYTVFYEKVMQPTSSLSLDDIEKFTLNLPSEIKHYIADEVAENLTNRLNSLKEQYKCFDNVQKAQSSILAMRNKLADIINARPYEMQHCPLCGHDYTSSELLLKNIEKQGQHLTEQIQTSLTNIQNQFNTLKKEIQILVIEPIIRHFAEKSITDEVCKRYTKLDFKQLSKTLNIFFEKFHIVLDTSCGVADITTDFSSQLKTAIQEIDDALDYNVMDKVYTSYGRYIKTDCLKDDFIQKKRLYLIEVWNKSKSEQLKIYERDKEYAQKTLENIDSKIKEFKSLRKDILDSERLYLGKLLSDIKILFYIYSGRIMQDNYFGRGLFIRENLDRKRVLITSSKDENNEVDALFNMSSGQLVSIVVALTLSLNKLYSSVPFIAIDDPIQTMDDINLWGLIETLRHDFSDHFMVLSTHETDYGKLLEYKLKKWNIDTEYIDMSQIRRK